MKIKKHQVFTILLVCFSVSFTLLLCEIILRIKLSDDYYIWPPNLKKTFSPYKNVMPGITGESRFESNSLGFRGDELTPSHNYRILTIGGSTTECLYLDQEETWPYLLQKKLNEDNQEEKVWVGNGGMAARTSRHHLTAMQFLPLGEMKIDLIILLLGVNDFATRLSRDKDYDPHFLEKPQSEKDMLRSTFVGGNFPFPTDNFIKRTAMWRMLRVTKGIFVRQFNQEVSQDEAGEIYITWRNHRKWASEIRSTLPDLSSALSEYEKIIDRIIDIAKENSIRLIFMTQPTMWKAGLSDPLKELLWFGGVGNYQKEKGKPYYSISALEKGMNDYNYRLLTVCKARQIECIDLASVLEKDTTVYYDDCHFNESGARKVAAVVFSYMQNHEAFKIKAMLR